MKNMKLTYSPGDNPLVLFRDAEGEGVSIGDQVEFYKEGSVFPCCGTITSNKTLECWDSLFQRWITYNLEDIL